MHCRYNFCGNSHLFQLLAVAFLAFAKQNLKFLNFQNIIIYNWLRLAAFFLKRNFLKKYFSDVLSNQKITAGKKMVAFLFYHAA